MLLTLTQTGAPHNCWVTCSHVLLIAFQYLMPTMIVASIIQIEQ